MAKTLDHMLEGAVLGKHPEYLTADESSEMLDKTRAAIAAQLEALREGILQADPETTDKAELYVAHQDALLGRISTVTVDALRLEVIRLASLNGRQVDALTLSASTAFRERREEVMPDLREVRFELLGHLLDTRLAAGDYDGYLTLLEEDCCRYESREKDDQLLGKRWGTRPPSHPLRQRGEALIMDVMQRRGYDEVVTLLQEGFKLEKGLQTMPEDAGDFTFDLLLAEAKSRRSRKALDAAKAVVWWVAEHPRGYSLQKTYEKKPERREEFTQYLKRDLPSELFEAAVESGEHEWALELAEEREAKWRKRMEDFQARPEPDRTSHIDRGKYEAYVREQGEISFEKHKIMRHYVTLTDTAEFKLRSRGRIVSNWPTKESPVDVVDAALERLRTKHIDPEQARNIPWVMPGAEPDAEWIPAVTYFMGDRATLDQQHALARFAVSQVGK